MAENTSSQHTIHLIGIGGTGMSAIARVLLESGYTVTGSDRQLSPLAKSLQDAGARVFLGHRPENIQAAAPACVLRSSAVRDDNPEVQAARQAGIPVLKRSDFLGDLMAAKRGIAVAGSHGKTTTTAMIAWLLTALGQRPSYIIGGVSANLGANAHAGAGECFVIEADEYDGMFLGLRPQIAVVTNIEHDHPDCYPTPEDFYQAFAAFVRCLKPGGLLIACREDRGALRLLQESAQAGLRLVSYGLTPPDSAGAAQVSALYYHASSLTLNAHGGFTFEAITPAQQAWKIHLQAPGQHNVLNALAAFAVADQLHLPLDQAAQALSEYAGTGRRFEVRGEAGGVAMIDDYAHHPAHIRATLAAARSRYPGRPLWVVWQPHTYSRTRLLLQDYAAALAEADHLIITEIYPAREAPPTDGFSSAQVVWAMRRRAPASLPAPDIHFTVSLAKATLILLALLQPGDVLLILSAGDADQICSHLLTALEEG